MKIKASDNIQKGFYHTSRAYYGNGYLNSQTFADEIMIGVYAIDPNVPCEFPIEYQSEFAIRWYVSNHGTVAKLEMYFDSWNCFETIPEVFEFFKNNNGWNMKPTELSFHLKMLGFNDLTETKDKKAETEQLRKDREEFARLTELHEQGLI